MFNKLPQDYSQKNSISEIPLTRNSLIESLQKISHIPQFYEKKIYNRQIAATKHTLHNIPSHIPTWNATYNTTSIIIQCVMTSKNYKFQRIHITKIMCNREHCYWNQNRTRTTEAHKNRFSKIIFHIVSTVLTIRVFVCHRPTQQLNDLINSVIIIILFVPFYCFMFEFKLFFYWLWGATAQTILIT